MVEEILSGDGIYFFGVGLIIKRIKDRLGVNGMLFGVDVVEVKDGKVRFFVKDVVEKDFLCFVDKNLRIVVMVIGGFNFFFGRGN